MLNRRQFGQLVAGAAVMSAAPARAATVQVAIEKLEFVPAAITVKVGDTIAWANNDRLNHTATVKGGWDVAIPAGQTGTLVLNTAGEFDYYCRYHPNMKGRLTVTA